MSSIDNRMSVNLSELNNLTEWLTRINYSVSNVELRRHNEPGIGAAITAYVETGDDEGYFKLLTNPEPIPLAQIERTLKESLNLAND